METGTKTPKWFTVVAVLALIWNLLGVMAYLMQVNMSVAELNKLPEAQRALYENIPAWVTSAFAIAVFGGTIGSLGLVLKKKWAVPMFIISLVAVIVQMYYTFFISDFLKVRGDGDVIMSVLVILIALYLWLLSRKAVSKGWIV